MILLGIDELIMNGKKSYALIINDEMVKFFERRMTAIIELAAAIDDVIGVEDDSN